MRGGVDMLRANLGKGYFSYYQFQWFDVGASGNGEPDWCLFVHLFAGFGMAGLPGVWKILFQDVLLGMARSEQQLTLPVPHIC